MKKSTKMPQTLIAHCAPGGCDTDKDICHCDCHDPKLGRYVDHLAPCCHQCPHCGQNIKSSRVLLHVGPCLRAKRKHQAQDSRVFTEREIQQLLEQDQAFDDISHVCA